MAGGPPCSPCRTAVYPYGLMACSGVVYPGEVYPVRWYTVPGTLLALRTDVLGPGVS